MDESNFGSVVDGRAVVYCYSLQSTKLPPPSHPAYCLMAGGSTDFSKQVFLVRLDRVDAQEESLANFPVGEAFIEQLQCFVLPLSQWLF